MKILFISSSPLKKEISIGNTFINLFDGMTDVELASIYTRSGKPDAKISKAFCITEKMIVRNLLLKTPLGVDVDISNESFSEKPQKKEDENGIIKFIKSHRWTFFFWIQNLIWRVGRWKSAELGKFVDEYNPDVIFTVLSDMQFLNELIFYIKRMTSKPLVLYAWDNNYSLKRVMFSPLKWINHFINRSSMRKIAKVADLMYVISEVQKKDYETAFKRSCQVLTKGHDFTAEVPVPDMLNKPLQLVYTGNIGMNRWKSLAHIANVLERINSNGVKAQLRIYTGNTITKKMKASLEKENVSFVMGSVSSEGVERVQNGADILVHVESMDLKNKLLVRQSFSTKLVDYFYKAKCIVAFGPKDVASISHLLKNDAAIVADNEKELEEKLNKLIENSEMIHEYEKKSWECGKNNHQKKEIQSMLKRDFERIVSM